MLGRQKELRFRVSEAELSQIQENAKTLGMQIHPFVRYVGTEYAVIVEDRTHSIRIKVSPQEEEKIQRFATLHHLPVGVYLRHVALHPHFVHIDYNRFVWYTSVVEHNLFRILEIANKIYTRGYYKWYEAFFVLRAVIHIAANERQLILKVADRRPKPAALSEKYPDVLLRFQSMAAKHRRDISHGTLTTLRPNV